MGPAEVIEKKWRWALGDEFQNGNQMERGPKCSESKTYGIDGHGIADSQVIVS
jgi:hypothetical protein